MSINLPQAGKRIFLNISDAFSFISGIYSAFLNFAVLVSSLFFIFWFLAILFFGGEKLVLVFLVALLFLSRRSKNKHINRLIIFFRKTTIIAGSILLLFLFLNSYLLVSDSINQQFLTSWRKIENLLNQAIFSGIFTFILFFLYIGFIFISASFILKIIKRIRSKGVKVFFRLIMTVLILSLLIFPYFVLEKQFLLSLGEILYSRLNWLFGFSLIFLHLSYLIKEIKKVVLPVG